MRIAVTGATGLIGKALVPALEHAGHSVIRLVRKAPVRPLDVQWNPARGELDALALGPIEAAIHLAGENVGDGRWSAARKRRIKDSRVDGTRTLVRALATLSERVARPATLLSASAVGFYGTQPEGDDRALTESAPPGHDFLADVCQAWEHEAKQAEALGVRVVLMRTGVVLADDGGVLARLLRPFRLGLGGKIGGGRQWMSWVSLDDVVRAYVAIVNDDSYTGPVNIVAPNPVTQAEFAKTLAHVLHRPSLVPLPKLLVKAAFGEMGERVVLEGQRVVPRVLTEHGFTWKHPRLELAIRDILKRLA